MKFRTTIAVAIVLMFAAAVSAQQNSPEQEITNTVLNYAEGWYEGDAGRMEKSLHPELAKRRIDTNAEGRSRMDEMSSLRLVQVTRPGYGKNTPKAEQMKTVKILDIYGDMATVRLEMRDWIDYMHLAKTDGQWKIVNVLWDRKPGN
ncbi:MAG: nuclear transport factor 2 family protein [Acidobacteria bacterium]|nr:MAG: nuclear transport factor 2 family protein [Acidobacteriota bacterium]REK01710.1 MAG: nuclear transport factor 2 family protein [Acidobacteriota bacterium]REK14666.1 MAG: nuclear transport factor 2 family protein [Acidobacteriota bacterium]REK45381.1 MAG: nuclear transport factor 2 family protein [Acidobacteriota bacterium]